MMGSTVEVGAVISDLESEYERSKKFLEDLYRSLEVNRNDGGDAARAKAGEDRPTDSLTAAELDKEPKEPAMMDPFATYELTREDSCVSNCSECSNSVSRVPALRTNSRSPNALPSPTPSGRTVAYVPRRDDAAYVPPATPKKKTSAAGGLGAGIYRKPSGLLVSCPVLECPGGDETTAQATSCSGGLLDPNLSRRTSNNSYMPPGAFSSLDSMHLAHVLAPSPPPVPTGRHRRSSLDFIPAPPAHMRKWIDQALMGGPPPAPLSSGPASAEPIGHRLSNNPNKQRSLEVLGSQATAGSALTPTPQPGGTASMPRPSQAGTGVSFRRSSIVVIGSAQPPSPTLAQHPPQPHPAGHGDHHNHQHQHHLQLLSSLDSPGLSGAGIQLHHHAASAGQVVVPSGSASGGGSPNVLPPLQSAASGTPPTQALSAPGHARAVHSSLEFGPGAGPLGGRGSWSGGPLPPSLTLPTAAESPVENSPRDRTRAGRFARCSPSTPSLTSPNGVLSSPGGAQTASALTPTPPTTSRDRGGRLLAVSDSSERPLPPRTSSLLTGAVLKSPIRGSSHGLLVLEGLGGGAGVGAGGNSAGGAAEGYGDTCDLPLVSSPGGSFISGVLPQFQHHGQAGRTDPRGRSLGGGAAH